VPQRVADLRRREPRREGHRNQLGACGREQRRDEVEAVREQRGEPVAGGQAEAGEPPGEPRHAVGQLRERERAAGRGQCGAVAVLSARLIEDGGEVHVNRCMIAGTDPSARCEAGMPTTAPTPVLLVDDQPLMAAALRRLLATAPEFVMHYCQDPCRAVGEVEAASPAAVIVDMVMPGVGGLEVIRRLRDNPATATLPIVMMSSIDDPFTKAEALDAGADDYLIKLPDAQELVARLRALLRRARWAAAVVTAPRA
jgi:CheY-like chemotaxis protein